MSRGSPDIWSDKGEKKIEQMQGKESEPLILGLLGTELVKELLRAEIELIFQEHVTKPHTSELNDNVQI